MKLCSTFSSGATTSENKHCDNSLISTAGASRCCGEAEEEHQMFGRPLNLSQCFQVVSGREMSFMSQNAAQ